MATCFAWLRLVDRWRLVDVALVTVVGTLLGATAAATTRDLTSGWLANALAFLPALVLLSASLQKQLAAAVAGIGSSSGLRLAQLPCKRTCASHVAFTVPSVQRHSVASVILLQYRNLTESAQGALGDGCWEIVSPAPADSSSSGDGPLTHRRRPSALCGVLTGASLSPGLRPTPRAGSGVSFQSGAVR